MKNLLIGLCGRSGSGKGYVADLFEKEGIPSVDTDIVYRNMTSASSELSQCMKELVDRFGNQVICEDNSLNRAVMRSLVFGDDHQALLDLNTITHRHILKESLRIAEDLNAKGFPIVLIDAPLLFESGFDSKCARVICVTAPEKKLVQRIMRRDGISKAEAYKRLHTQKSVKELSSRADYVIKNNGNDKSLLRQVKLCANELKSLVEKDSSNEI